MGIITNVLISFVPSGIFLYELIILIILAIAIIFVYAWKKARGESINGIIFKDD